MTPKVAAPQSEAALTDRLRAACVGKPYAKIPWPHYLLHEAAAALLSAERQRREALSMLSKLRGKFADGDSCPVCFNDLPEHEKGCVLAEAEALLEGSTQ